jgi:hypothetical protein
LFGLHSSTKVGQTKEAQASINFLGKSKEAVGKDVEYFRGFEKNWLGLNPESEQGKALWSVYLSNPQLNNLTEADKEKLSLTGNDKKTKDQLNALQAYGVQQDVYEKTGQVVDSRNWPKNFLGQTRNLYEEGVTRASQIFDPKQINAITGNMGVALAKLPQSPVMSELSRQQVNNKRYANPNQFIQVAKDISENPYTKSKTSLSDAYKVYGSDYLNSIGVKPENVKGQDVLKEVLGSYLLNLEAGKEASGENPAQARTEAIKQINMAIKIDTNGPITDKQTDAIVEAIRNQGGGFLK